MQVRQELGAVLLDHSFSSSKGSPENGISGSNRRATLTQLNFPISIFFLIALWPWYTNESIIPETVNTPAHQEDFVKSSCFR
jgi:hypothetical protein